MRILFTTTLGSAEWAGSEVLWHQGAEKLIEKGHHVGCVMPKQMHTQKNWKRLNDSNIELVQRWGDQFQVGITRVCRRLRPKQATGISPIVQHARKWKADFVVFSQASCWGSYTDMLALAEYGIKFGTISQLNTPFSWLRDGLHKVVASAFSKAEFCVFVSEGNKSLFENQIAGTLENARVICNPLSFDSRELGASPKDGSFRLLNVARIDPGHKGQDIILDVLAMPKWKARNVSLEIAGGGAVDWLEDLIKVKALNNVKILGHVDDLASIWERAHYGVFPSRYEGMPLAMIEGMMLGRPMVATDVAGHGEWIESGLNGFLAEGCTAKSFDLALSRAWQSKDEIDVIGRNARKTAIEKLNPKPSLKLAQLITDFLPKT